MRHSRQGVELGKTKGTIFAGLGPEQFGSIRDRCRMDHLLAGHGRKISRIGVRCNK